MTLEEFLRHAYGLAMTPLPQSALPDVDPAAVKARLAGLAPPDIDLRSLPTMPDSWRAYAASRGMLPEQRGALEQLQPPPAFSPTGRQVGSVVYTPSRLLEMRRQYEAAGGR